MLSLRGKKRSLNLLTLLLLAASGYVLMWGTQPVGQQPPHPRSHETPRAELPSEKSFTGTKMLSAAEFEAYWNQPLRRRLYDPPPPEPPPVVKEPPRPLTSKLLATMLEAENSSAMLQLASGEVVFRRVGEVLGPQDADATIAEINSGVIRVVREDNEQELRIDEMRR